MSEAEHLTQPLPALRKTLPALRPAAFNSEIGDDDYLPSPTQIASVSDGDLLCRPLPDLRGISLETLSQDPSHIVTELRHRLLDAAPLARMAAFQSEVGDDECFPPSTSSS